MLDEWIVINPERGFINISMKQKINAYLISAYLNPLTLKQLVDALNEEEKVDFYIHVDAKCNILEFSELLCGYSNVFFLKGRERVKVFWGGYSQVKMEYNLIKSMLHTGTRYHRIFYLTGMDYPLVSNRAMQESLVDNMEYIIGFDVSHECAVESPKGSMKDKFLYFWNLDTRIGVCLTRKKFKKRKQYEDLKCSFYFGSEYWALTYDCIKYVFETYSKNKRLQRMLRFCFSPGEAWVHTVIFNSKWKERGQIYKGSYRGLASLSPISYFDYGKEIKILNDSDYNRLINSQKLFCRKVKKGVSDNLVAMIDSVRTGNCFPWNGNEIVELAYKKDNYRVIDLGRQSGNAIIFFSGNGLYFPNSEEVFQDTICDKDRYEWEHISTTYLIRKKYSRIIFIRDVYKQWYVSGISSRINSIEKVIELVRKLTVGFDVVTCGNSAGGYMAMLVGKAIGAKKIFSFSGQFSLKNQVCRAPFLSYYEKDLDYNKYYDLGLLMGQRGQVFHFYPAYAIQDIEQIKISEEMDKGEFYPFAFDGNCHGVTVAAECYEYLLTMDSDRLIALSKRYKSRLINKLQFYEDILYSHDFIEIAAKCMSHINIGNAVFYIWGTGADGEKCYKLFKRLGGVKIEGVIDNYRKQEIWHGYNIITPNELRGMKGIICIATKKHETEIVEQLQEMKFEKDKYICFAQLKERIFESIRMMNKV